MEKTVMETLEQVVTFSSANWQELGGAVADAFRFTKKERASFLGNNLPRLIAAIPFIADCDDPERTAISHLGTYVLSIRAKRYALAQPSDDEYVLKRLELLNNFSGGNADIINRGMNLIA
ncbi:MAG: hypothetical protein HN368_17955, partial [Spirochaetales bacterium]|nr:hypothetical protein [Spirochaetales bacterium]